ncbi:MAG TPA: hypothetical protein DIW47_08895 [Bacteroidetes bacterium]|nr:hypothetical protein [Bacteroidota bacterium]
MFGYPTANIETKGKSIFVQPFIFSSPYLRAEQNTNVRMWFNRNKVFRGGSQIKQTAPPIFGCSGGGMWHYNEAEKTPVLIGIVHYVSGIESFITGTNILFILGNLKHRLENDSLLK